MTNYSRISWFYASLMAAAIGAASRTDAQQPMFTPPTATTGSQLPTNVAYTGTPSGALYQMTSMPTGVKMVGPVDRRPGNPNVGLRLGYARKSGLQLAVELNWPGQFGYRPVKVTVRPRRPASSDQQIRIRFRAGTWQSRGRSIEVDRTLVLRAGDASATAVLLAPQYLDWHLFGWEAWFDGQQDDELSVEINNNQQGMTSHLAVLATPPDLSAGQLQSALQGPSGSSVLIASLGWADMPQDWLAYSSLDLVVMPANHLPLMASTAPQQTEALLRWVRTGGNLWLVSEGTQWEGLKNADLVLDKYGGGAWKSVPLGERAIEPVEQALVLSDFDSGDRPTTAKNLREMIGSLVTPGATSERWFRVRAHGLGVVAAFPRQLQPPDPSEISDEMGRVPTNPSYGYAAANAVNSSLLAARFHAAARQGNYPGASNSEFNNLLIPNVGVAPVTQFQLLITLFALAIGPANYWWFKSRKKLPLLLVTTPLAALAVTAALLSYGVFADGVGVRVRARSLTLLDQRTGESASWARLSYYAGMAPRDGLRMPADTALYPILPDWSDDYRMGRQSISAHQRTVEWNDGQHLSRGWLPSRTPTQYLAVTARPTKNRLRMRVVEKGLRVVNELGVHVLQATVRDHDGKEYYLENLAAEAGVIVPVARRQDIAMKMRKAFSDNFPTFPSGAEAPDGLGNYGAWLSKNLMEARLDAINSPMVQHWGDGSYIAITSRGVEVDLGVEPINEEASFHVIEGRW